jgi:DHA1 family bicyclomycin/chloramphenicol resistance-like MFS transporter
MPASQTTPPRRPPLFIIIAVVACGPLAIHILVPSLPGLQSIFDTNYATVQLTLTLYFFAFAGAQLIYGPLSDRFGRRPVLLAGMALYVGGGVICLSASTIEVLIGGRIVQGIGGCAGFVLARAIVRDLYEREKAASMLAYVTMAMVVVPMMAPGIGGYLDLWFGWWASFFLVVTYGIVVTVAAILVLHETNMTRQPLRGITDLTRSYGQLLRLRVFRGYAFQVGFSTGAFFTFVGGASYVMVEVMGRPASEYGLYFMIVAGMYMIGNFGAGRLSVGVGIDRMIVIGTSLSLLATAVLFILSLSVGLTPLSLFGLTGFMVMGSGLSQANGLAGAVSVDPTRAGAASGISGFLQMMIGALGTQAVGMLLNDTAVPLTAAMLLMLSLSLLSHVVGVRMNNPDPATPRHP